MGSVRRRGGRVHLTLEAAEIELLVSFISQVLLLLEAPGETATERDPSLPIDPLEALLGPTPSGPVRAPDDPVLRRLLPDAYAQDPAAADEFRRFTDADMRARKREALQQILDDLDVAEAHPIQQQKLRLDEPAATAWLHGLADVRLALGTRLDVTEDLDGEQRRRSPGHPDYAEFVVYDWLSWLQDGIVTSLMGD